LSIQKEKHKSKNDQARSTSEGSRGVLFGSAVLDEAEPLVNRLGKLIGLRALDAIHLATFSLLNQFEEMPLVATDDILLSAARSCVQK